MTTQSERAIVAPADGIPRRYVVGEPVGAQETWAEVVSVGGLLSTEGAADAFGRLRVSEPQAVFDSKAILDNQPFLFDDAAVSGAGTSSTHSAARASVTLGVSASTAGLRARQSRRRMAYQPGKSQLAFLTFVMGAAAAGITRRAGLFDGADGIFLMADVDGPAMVIRSSVSGSPVESVARQATWNIDPLDGTGPSGLTLDLTRANILLIDYEWLGVGRVRTGFVIGGALVYVHEFAHANVVTSVYMSTPNLPVRWDIANDGTGGAATIEAICASVMSEGGQERTGITRTIDRAASGLVTLNDADLYPLIAIRLDDAELDATVRAIAASVFCTSSAVFRWALLLNPTVAGTALSFADVANSAMEAAVGATNATKVSGGTVIASGYAESTSQNNIPAGGVTDHALGASIAGVSDVLVLAVQRLTGTTETFYGTLTVTEQV